MKQRFAVICMTGSMAKKSNPKMAIRRATHYIGEALREYLAASHEINYSAENSDILTAIGFRPDAASRVDNQQKYTPVQNRLYAHRLAELSQQPPA